MEEMVSFARMLAGFIISISGSFAVYLPECLGGRPNSRSRDAGDKSSVGIDQIVGCGRAEVQHQHRSAVQLEGSGRVHDPVRSDLPGILRHDLDPGADARSHNDRRDMEIFDDPAGQGMHDIRHNAGNNHILDFSIRTDAIASKDIADNDAKFIRCAVDPRGNTERPDQILPVKNSQGNIGVPTSIVSNMLIPPRHLPQDRIPCKTSPGIQTVLPVPAASL